jgi:pimeloyl-ACP methyl ester carboxylesterase
MKRNLFVIHGAWSSRQGFKYIEQNIRYDNVDQIIQFTYDCSKEPLNKTIERAKKELYDSGVDTIVLGHSLGGLIALSLHDEQHCYKLITLSTPLSGVAIHPMLLSTIAMRAPILMTIERDSRFIQNLQESEYTKNIHSFITTKGFNPLILDKSDGVVTVYSQEQWLPSTAISTQIKCNHFEILQRDEVVAAIDRYSDI